MMASDRPKYVVSQFLTNLSIR